MKMQVKMLEANIHLSSLVAAVERGKDELVPYGQVLINPPGAWKGLVAHTADWNSAETQAQIDELFLADGEATSRLSVPMTQCARTSPRSPG
jgi:hypothetical protein